MAEYTLPNPGDGIMKKKNMPLLQMTMNYAAIIVGGSFVTGIAKILNIDWIISLIAILASGYVTWVSKDSKELDLDQRIKHLWLSSITSFISIWCGLIGFPTPIMSIMLIINFLFIYAQALHKAKNNRNSNLCLKNILLAMVVLFVSVFALHFIFQPLVDKWCYGIYEEFRTFHNKDIIGCILIQSRYICFYGIPFYLCTSTFKFVLSDKAFVYNKKNKKVLNVKGLWKAIDDDFNKTIIGSESKNCDKIAEAIDKILYPIESKRIYR